MCIALASLAVKPARVQPSDVETAKERFPAVQYEKLAVVALKISQRVSEIKGTKPAKPHAAAFQFPPKLVEIPLAGTESVEMQPHVKPGSRFGCEQGDKTRPDFVGGKDVGFHPDRFGRALYRREHRIEKSISLDEQLESAPPFAQIWHTDRLPGLRQRHGILTRCVRAAHDRGLPPHRSSRNIGVTKPTLCLEREFAGRHIRQVSATSCAPYWHQTQMQLLWLQLVSCKGLR